MSSVLAGALVITLLLTSLPLLLGSLTAGVLVQTEAGRKAWAGGEGRILGIVEITSVTAMDDAGGTNVTVEMENTGNAAYAEFERMDVFVRYVRVNGEQLVGPLDYQPGSAGNGEWTIDAIAPDGLHPGMWDPGEAATLAFRVVPPLKKGKAGTVAVVMPNGVRDAAYFTH